MAEFAYNNAKNASTHYILFQLNCNCHLKVLFQEDINPRLRFCFIDKLARELKKLIEVCYQNLFYAQELQKRDHHKKIKNYSYASVEKI